MKVPHKNNKCCPGSIKYNFSATLIHIVHQGTFWLVKHSCIFLKQITLIYGVCNKKFCLGETASYNGLSQIDLNEIAALSLLCDHGKAF